MTSAKVGQEHRAEGTCQRAREVHDANAHEGPGRSAGHRRSPLVRGAVVAAGPGHRLFQWLRFLTRTVRSPSNTRRSS